jgi:hypothetical protein
MALKGDGTKVEILVRLLPLDKSVELAASHKKQFIAFT